MTFWDNVKSVGSDCVGGVKYTCQELGKPALIGLALLASYHVGNKVLDHYFPVNQPTQSVPAANSNSQGLNTQPLQIYNPHLTDNSKPTLDLTFSHKITGYLSANNKGQPVFVVDKRESLYENLETVVTPAKITTP